MSNDTNISFDGFLNYLNFWAKYKTFILNSVEEIILKLNENTKNNPWTIGEDFVTDNNCKIKQLFCGKYLSYNGVDVVYIGLNPNMVHFYDTSEDNKVIYTKDMQECFLSVDIVSSYTVKNKNYTPLFHPREKDYPSNSLEKYNYYKINAECIKNKTFVNTVLDIIKYNFNQNK